ncbi:protein MAINTENANCE OF MERISTEMS-like [Lotus japonicus]|uniref:protein MAINTENANCE OF MERISTEMS-like n=1 Tax=Lotus japonicus TaxID=34305 RepID=UPI002584592F|nr:protein MAINTENANCE OF MERISTEMS-like [Lotus japonicus]
MVIESPAPHDTEQGSGEGEEESSGEEEEEEGSTEEKEEEEEEEDRDAQADQGEEDDDDDIFFPGGPYDNTLLKSFKQHISLEVWKRYKKPAEVLDRGVLKIYHHGNAMLGNDKVKHKDVLKCFSTYVKGRVVAAGLLPLLTCNLPSVDKTMLIAFVERWQPETSSFHMPFGEMTITLDDVSCLLHIPVKDKFFTLTSLTREEAATVLHKQLGVTQAAAEEEIWKSLGPYARYTWLLKVAEDMAKEGKTKKAARAFLLRLVGMTIFCGKTNNKVDVAYLGMFMDLEKVEEYAWGAMALAFLYDQLKDATKHFPASLFDRNLNRKYSEKDPRACKWVTKKGTVDLHAKRLILDDLRDNNVIWTPYDGQRMDWPFQQECLYSGWIRHSVIIRPYLPKCVLRQFHMLQDQPNLPPANMPPVEHIDERFENMVHCVAAQHTDTPTTTPHYFEWYKSISHRFVVPPETRGPVAVTLVDVLEQLRELSDITVDPSETPQRILEANQRMRDIIMQHLEYGGDDDDSGSGNGVAPHGGGGPDRKKKGKASTLKTS